MTRYLRLSLLLLAVLSFLGSTAQKRDKLLSIEVYSADGDDLAGQPITLMQTDYEVSYGRLTLDSQGRCTVKVYGGNHSLTIEREGFEPLTHNFFVSESETEVSVVVTLKELTRDPYALQATVEHDAYTGRNSVILQWNTEAPAFFDDFEGYAPFAIEFGEWTGIDADLEAAAPLIGTYPNRGVMQYAQIINPLTVEPTWWYEYPILRPYDGQQYVGFTRTSSGNANDDWLISPVITVGTDNVLSFMGKAADQYPERFMVYVTTKTDSPTQADFTRIDTDNYETADYRGWREYKYDLSAYAGQQIKFAIRYISHYNFYGSFMLMIDDVYVGQAAYLQSPMLRTLTSRLSSHTSHLSPHKSPANANETFRIFLDGEQAGTTDEYTFTIDDVAEGQHTLGVQAVYLQGESSVTTTDIFVAPASNYSCIEFNVTTRSKLSPDGQVLTLLSKESAKTYSLTVADGKAMIASLPNGEYLATIEEGPFEAWQQSIAVSGDATVDVELADNLLTPYNITASTNDDGTITLHWNQELLFSDSFEDYDDFATGEFGGWKSYNLDQMPVYPIALGNINNVVSFPGSGTANNPTAIAPMVFNPWHTTPAMLPTDQAIAAPTGDKTVIFFSAQQTRNDKWLVSPLVDIHQGYMLTVKAKGYEAMYPESMEFCVSQGSDKPVDFTVLSQADQLSSGQWAEYQTDLSAYEGQTVRLAIHYTSYDAFLAQVDDFTVGPEDGQGETVDYGNILHFDIYLDGQKIGEAQSPQFTLTSVSEGSHTVGIVAVYLYGQSQMAEFTVDGTSGIWANASDSLNVWRSQPVEYFTLQGQPVRHLSRHGIYIERRGGNTKTIYK